MKKVIATSSLLIGVVFLSGCSSQQIENQTQSTSAADKIVTSFTCGSQVKDASGITYGTVIAEDGKCWLDRNLGATEVATSSTDKSAYGWYFQWGRNADGHQLPTSGETTTLSPSDNPGHSNYISASSSSVPPLDWDWRSPRNDNLWQGVNGINNPCPPGFRVPTISELMAVVSAAKITNSITAFNSTLRLIRAGDRGNFEDADVQDGFYWSSSVAGVNAYFFGLGLKFINPPYSSNPRSYSASVRCIKD